jgi:adenylate cyclase
MRSALLTWAYRRLGRRYPAVFITVELQAGFAVTAGTVGLLSFYYEGSAEQFGQILVIALGLTAFSLGYGLIRIRPRLRPIAEWIDGERDEVATARAWSAAIALPLELVRREMVPPILAVVLPSCIAAILILDLTAVAFIPLFAASMVAIGYGAILHYLTIEAGMRPVLFEMGSAGAPATGGAGGALSLRVRLLAALPLINVITGLLVAALTGDGAGERSLGLAVLVAIGVATTVSLELTLLLSRSILRPLADLQRATDRVREGDFDVSVPVTTGDEIGGLATSFNGMVAGLRERERIREAFGTYLDKQIADYILSEGFDERGVEIEVSVLFCDVRDFTSFAATAEPPEVVACLNELFEVVVPVVARHGGHVDKFEGDGLMAIFGAPEGFPDHAERAVRAALEIDRRVNRGGEGGPFEIGIGINTGSVVAGSIGGGGRLNFSVIGDSVNVAARVEEATRETGDAVLITEAARDALGSGFPVERRGERELRGLARPVGLFVPAASERAGDQLKA